MGSALAENETFRFDRLEDLARLPWFDVDGDRLVVSDASVGPIIDMHAHYALPAIWPLRFDLERESERTELLLRVHATMDAREVGLTTRSEARRVGKECHYECRSRWPPYH